MTPTDEEYSKLKWLLERFSKAEDYCKPYFERAKRHYKLYRLSTAVTDEDWPYVNRVRSRDIMAFVEDTTAILIQTLFATMPFISVIPRESNNAFIQQTGIDMIKIADQIERCLDYQLSHEKTDFLEEIIDYIKSGGIQGTSYIGVYPNFENGEYVLPLLKTAGFWDVLPVPGSKRISKARGLYLREFMGMDDLYDLQKMGVYQNVDNVHGKSLDEDKWHKQLLEETGLTNYVDTDDVELLHYFSGGHVITFANRKTFLRDSTIPVQTMLGQIMQSPFPYDNPLVQYKYMPVPDEFFGIGIPEVLEVLQEDKNLIRSARRDNIDLCINKILMTKEGSDMNYDLIRFFPGAIWPDSMGKIEALEIGDVTQSSYVEEKGIQADMENALSLFGYARGMTPSHTEQPTTVMKLQQASLNRQDVNVKLAETTVLQEIARKIVALNRRYMKKETYEAIIGEPDAGFFQLPESWINRCYTMKPVGSSITHIKEVRQQQIQMAIQLAMSIPPQVMQSNIRPFTIDYLELFKEALDAADIKTKDRIVIELGQQGPDPMQQMITSAIMSNPDALQAMMGGYGGNQQQPEKDTLRSELRERTLPRGVNV